jgi:hypothetical protein
MNDVMVVASCTERKGLTDVYERQLADAGIDHFFEKTDYATSSFNMRKRIDYWHSLALRFGEYKMLVITDAWDVLFFGTKQDLLDKVQTILISAEKNCFPGPEFGEEDLTDRIKGPTPWRYANPGMVAANPDRLLGWLAAAERTANLDISDQAWCNRRLVDTPELVPLDTTTSLFYVISYNDGRFENDSLQINHGRLWNSECGTYPNFIHFAGHGPQEVERVLAGHDTPRYEAMNLIRRHMRFPG